MKLLVSLLSVLFLAQLASAQKQIKYCEVELDYRLFKGETFIHIRTGDDKRLYQYIKNQDSSFLKKGFNSKIDAVNFMARNGWELKATAPNNNGKSSTDFLLYFAKEFTVQADTLLGP